MTQILLELIIRFCSDPRHPFATPGSQRKGFLVRPLLDAMSAEWSLTTFPLQRPKKDSNGTILLGQGKDRTLWNLLYQLTPTLLSILKGNATVLRLFDRDAEGNAVCRAFGDLRAFGMRGGEKIAKRLSALWQEVSHFMIMPNVDMFAAQLNINTNGQAFSVTANREARRAGKHYGKGTDRTTIAIYDVPAENTQFVNADWLKSVFDGKGNYIRPSVICNMTNEALDRARSRDPRLASLLDGFSVEMVDGKMVNNIPPTAGKYARRLFLRRFAAKIMNGRMILPILGMVKGDWIIAASDDALCADFVVCSINIKEELYSLTDTTYFTANPVYQNTSRKSSRQSIAHLHSWVLPHGRLVNNFRAYVNRTLEGFRNKLPEWIGSRALEDMHRDDPINDVQRKAALWSEAGLPVRFSPFLIAMLKRQFIDMNVSSNEKSHRDDDKFPIQAGQFSSAKSVADLMIAGYVPSSFVLPEGTWMDSDIGMITCDTTYACMIIVLGKGDGDDHVEILMIEVLYSIDIGGLFFEAGDVASIVVRYPLGYSSDGVDYGSEYYILKPDADVTARYLKSNPNGLPTVDLAMRPMRADRVNVVQTLFPVSQPMPNQNYTLANAKAMFWACTYSMVTGGIGAMANLQMLAASMGVAIALPCDTETMVDAVAGVAPSFQTSIDALVAVQAAYRQLEALGLPIDELALDRLADNFSPAVQADPNGFLTLLYAARDAEMARARAEIDIIANDGLDELRRMFGGVSWKPFAGGDAPLLVALYRQEFAAVERIRGESDHLRFRRVGNNVVAKMEEMGYMSIMDRAIAQAIAHQLTAAHPESTMIDQILFQGALFEHTLAFFARYFGAEDGETLPVLVAINCTATTHADGCELLESVTPREAAYFIDRGRLSYDCSAAGMDSWLV